MAIYCMAVAGAEIMDKGGAGAENKLFIFGSATLILSLFMATSILYWFLLDMDTSMLTK